MRAFLILPLSAALLGGCLTSQENPHYEQSSTYQGDLEARHQYAYSAPIEPTMVSHETAPAQQFPANPFPTQPSTIEAYSSPTTTLATTTLATTTMATAPTTVMINAPTDSVYGTRQVTGTPGFMAMENARQAVAIEAAAQVMPEAEFVSVSPLGAAGTPVSYDYARNFVAVEANTTGQQMPATVRTLQGAGQNYTVQQGDTVYSLSRKTCVGVSVIQSLNGLNTDYAIKIGQSITLPTPVC